LQEQASSFGAVAPFYDELMRSVPYRMWVGYYLLLLSVQDAHPKTILDVCCGTGTMCEMLSAEGFKVAGFDISAPMIEEAKRKAQAQGLDIPYWCMDATSFRLDRTFDAAFSFYDSLNNITDPAGLQGAFNSVAAHLLPGGSWIFDLNTAFAFEERMFDQQNMRQNARLKYKWQGDYDKNTKLITVRMQFWRKGEPFEEVHVQRAYDEDHVREMLGKAGFTEIRSFHSYTLEKPRENSDRIHYTAIKA
jgi:ubiquinone/menaquinone biosynthesis C-methylase UbiE